MRAQDNWWTVASAIFVALAAAAPQASSEPISRSNWIPNVGQLNVEGEQPLGDLWTFKCPTGGTVNVSVDTKDDTDDAQADIDPVVLVVDGAGNLLASGMTMWTAPTRRSAASPARP
jgi:hypothetical protein